MSASVLWLLLAISPPAPLERARAIVEAAHTDGTRDCFSVVVPERVETLEPPYAVEVLATYGAWVPSAWILEIDRTTSGATVRWTDARGRRETTLGAERARALDEWAELAGLLAGARQENRGLCLQNVGYASHMPSRAVTIRRRGREVLRTAPTQPIHDDLGHGLPVFTASWTSSTLEALVRGWLADIERAPIPTAEAKRRLAALPAASDQKTRTAIEARLLAANLASSGDRSAIALLRRKGFAEDASRLDLRTTPVARLGRRLEPMLCSPKWSTRQAAKDELERLGAAARGPLLHAAGCKQDEYAEVEVLDALAALGPDAATAQVLDDAAKSSGPLRVQVTARAHRFMQRGDLADLAFIEATAKGGAAARPELTDEQRLALGALDRIATADPKWRVRVAAFAAALLDRIPLSAHATFSGMSQLVSMLGRHDAARHEVAIRRALDHDDASVVVDAIRALEGVDLGAAAAEARRRIAHYNTGKADGAAYSWNVLPYLELLARTDARDAVPQLREALARLEAGDEASAWKIGSHRALVQYLVLTTDADRAAAALEFIRAHGAPEAALRDVLKNRHGMHGVDDAAIEAAIRDHGRRASTWRE